MDSERDRELERRRQHVRAGGGEARQTKQRQQGKWTARQRLEALYDSDSFQELGMFVEHRSTEFGMAGADAPGDGVVTGFGRVDGRLVYAFAQDFTVLGGSLGEMHARKIHAIQDLALKSGAPILAIADSGGARIQEGIDSLNGYGEIFRRNTMASGVIPQLSLIVGPSAGGAVYSPALTDFVLMAEGIGQMYITGPQVIKAVTGEEVTHEALGGAQAHARKSGVAHLTYPDEPALFAGVKRLLSYLPSNNLASPPAQAALEPDPVAAGELAQVVPEDPNKPYDVRQVILGLVDEGTWLELQPGFAQNMVIGFGRLAGRVVAWCANQPRILAGCLDIEASDKLARFVRFADAFNLPLITLVDTPGYLPGTAQEYGGIIRHGAKVLYAYSEASVAKVSVVLRKAYGGAYLAMCSKSLGADLVLALPTAEIAVMGPEGAANIIFRSEIEQAEDQEATRKRLVAEYRDRFSSPYVAAGRQFVDQVVTAGELRQVLASALWALGEKGEDRPAKKHGNIPL